MRISGPTRRHRPDPASPRCARDWLAVLPRANKTIAIDLQTSKFVKSFDVPQLPGEILIRPDAAVAYITCMPAGKIAVVDLRTWQLQPTIDLTPGVDGMAWSAAK